MAVLAMPRILLPEIQVQGNRFLVIFSKDIAPMNGLYYWSLDGFRPTRTVRRLKKAYALWRTGVYDYILVSGGRVYPPDRETQPGALTMAGWLIGNKPLFDELLFPDSISPYYIVVEGESLDTYKNVYFTLKAIEAMGITDPLITLVGDWQQNRRAAWTFHALGCTVEMIDIDDGATVADRLVEWIYMTIHYIDPKGVWIGWALGGLNRWWRKRRSQS